MATEDNNYKGRFLDSKQMWFFIQLNELLQTEIKCNNTIVSCKPIRV